MSFYMHIQLCISEITISPRNPLTDYGWHDLHAMENCGGSGADFINCIKNQAYLEENILSFPLNSSIRIRSYFQHYYTGIVYSLELDTAMIGIKYHTTFKLSLNENLTYEIALTDPKLNFMSGNPETFPKAQVILQSKTKTIKLNLKPIRHEKLNLPAKPCDDSPDYNVGDCIEKSLMVKAGCQPPWRRVDVEDLPVCDNNQTLHKYSSVRLETWEMTRFELIQKTKCPMPCSYMEYKVNITWIIRPSKIMTQFLGGRKNR